MDMQDNATETRAMNHDEVIAALDAKMRLHIRWAEAMRPTSLAACNAQYKMAQAYEKARDILAVACDR